MPIHATQIETSVDNGLVDDRAAVAPRRFERGFVLRDHFVGLQVDDGSGCVGLMVRVVFDLESVTDDGHHRVRSQTRVLYASQQTQRFVDFSCLRIKKA